MNIEAAICYIHELIRNVANGKGGGGGGGGGGVVLVILPKADNYEINEKQLQQKNYKVT